MSSVTRPRGPLPARVYWTRRVLLLGLALGLVYGLAHLLGVPSSSPQARPVGAAAGSTTTPSATSQASAPLQAVPTVKAKSRKRQAGEATPTLTPTPTPTPLAIPSGPCAPQDVRVQPRVVGTAYAGSPVTFRLDLTTLESPACTWTVSPGSLVVKLTSGADRVWSTQDCKAAVRREPVVVRRDAVTSVHVTWHGQRSDGSCSRTTSWAEPGFYHVAAAALGAEPSDFQFELQRPQPATITPSPEPDHSRKHGNGGAGKPSDQKSKRVD